MSLQTPQNSGDRKASAVRQQERVCAEKGPRTLTARTTAEAAGLRPLVGHRFRLRHLPTGISFRTCLTDRRGVVVRELAPEGISVLCELEGDPERRELAPEVIVRVRLREAA